MTKKIITLQELVDTLAIERDKNRDWTAHAIIFADGSGKILLGAPSDLDTKLIRHFVDLDISHEFEAKVTGFAKSV